MQYILFSLDTSIHVHIFMEYLARIRIILMMIQTMFNGELLINDLGPVVQSILSLTAMLKHRLVKYMPTTLSNTLLFLKKKQQWICNIYVLNFNEKLTNDVVNFQQLAPGHH